MKIQLNLILSYFVIILFFITGCNQGIGINSKISECQGQYCGNEAFSWRYSIKNQIIYITHENYIANCCTSLSIRIDKDIKRNVYLINEKDLIKNEPCKCRCTYNISIELPYSKIDKLNVELINTSIFVLGNSNLKTIKYKGIIDLKKKSGKIMINDNIKH